MFSSGAKKSLYDVLGVKKTDACNDIKRAYLKLARIHHPDKGGDPEVFKEIGRASEVLTDEKRRRLYDETGITDEQTADQIHSNGGAGGFPPGFAFPFDMNLNDLFGGMFGNSPMGPNRGPVRKGRKDAPAVQQIPVTLEQFYLGHNFDININRQSFCKTCDHSGAKVKEICKKCNGQGAVTQIVQMGPMTMHTTGPCLDCHGKGERILEVCGKCLGTGMTSEKRTLAIKIIPGTKAQETFIFPEVCSDHPNFERPGDAHIIIVEDPKDETFKVFRRLSHAPQHMETTVTLSLAESLIGCVVQLDGHPGYDEGLFVRIPAGSFQGDRYCLANYGMPIPGNIGKYGDLFLQIQVSILSEERVLLATKGRESLMGLFEANLRKTVCEEQSIQTDLVLEK
jgi:DnaJ family protein A protein 2